MEIYNYVCYNILRTEVIILELNFTQAQKNAIMTKDCSLLVAAGAGSGKTRVLTERIIENLLAGDADITDFLIVTFTNAAAKEMQERIKKALAQRSIMNPDNKRLTHNLALLPQARISTISSFCFDIVKENFQKLGLSPKLRIAEEAEADVMLEMVFDGIIEERLSQGTDNKAFIMLYETFAGKKSDKSFLKALMKYYEKLTNLPSMKAYLEECVKHYKELSECKEVFDTFYGRLIKDIVKSFSERAKQKLMCAMQAVGNEKELKKAFEHHIVNDLDTIENLTTSLESSFDAAFYCLKEYKPANITVSSKIPEPLKDTAVKIAGMLRQEREYIKAEIRGKYLCVSSDIIKLLGEDLCVLMKELADIMEQADMLFANMKMQKGVITFSDAERLALDILYDDVQGQKISSVAKRMSGSIRELYIDEYQDINPIQDMIFKALSRKDDTGKEYNRFLVGDAKQSIYGFRGARPEIFNQYRMEFEDLESEKANRRKIFMQNNFRCSENVIDFTNMVFEKIMSEQYTKDDALIYSKKEQNKIEAPVKIILCDANDTKTSSQERNIFEAQCVYEQICRLVGNSDVLGSNGEQYRFCDVAVLVQTGAEAKLLEKYLSDREIPVICEKGESFFDRNEIKLALSIIKSVNNPQRDIYTAGFMRSPIGAFEDDELLEIRIFNRKASIFTSAQQYLENFSTQPEKSELCAKIQRFLSLHSELRHLSRNCTASDFIKKMYKKTDIVNICACGALERSFGEGIADAKALVRRRNLIAFYDMARDFDKTVFKGISSFIGYIDMRIRQDNTKGATSNDDNCVQIMTIHKSKGLEFPVCILFGCAKKEKAKNDNKIIMNENLGTTFKIRTLSGMKSIKNAKSGFICVETPLYTAITHMSDRLEQVESKRKLYVALTRAQERLILTAFPEKTGELEEKINSDKSYIAIHGESQLEWILSAISLSNENFRINKCGEYSYNNKDGRCVFALENKKYAILPEDEQEDDTRNSDDATYCVDEVLLEKVKNEIDKRQGFLKKIVSVPPKLTVSLLKQGLIDYEDTSAVTLAERAPMDMPAFIRENKDKTAAEKGISMHMFMQFANFDNCVKEGSKKEAQSLKDVGYITQKQLEMLDTEKLDRFFESYVYNEIKQAKKIFREHRFNLKIPACEVIADIPETEDFVLVQGVIDCFIENKDGTYTVIDFKTDRVSKDTGAEVLKQRYKNQILLYCRAVREITGKPVKKALIFSFSLMKEIDVSFN